MDGCSKHISDGRRFEFGKNWTFLLKELNDERIIEAEKSLKKMLEVGSLNNKNFLDVGSGSGLFSLAARRLGALVHSFDYDSQSVACTTELKRRYFKNDVDWFIEKGDVLDKQYLISLGRFDIVYSWGVLHHTGDMWQALDNIQLSVAPEGILYISIYNDQGRASRNWTKIKKIYNKCPGSLKLIILGISFVRLWGPTLFSGLLHGKPLYKWQEYIRERGMSPWRDVVDWVGGYPFEVAKPEEIFNFFRKRGFTLLALKTCAGGIGCNEFVLKKEK